MQNDPAHDSSRQAKSPKIHQENAPHLADQTVGLALQNPTQRHASWSELSEDQALPAPVLAILCNNELPLRSGQHPQLFEGIAQQFYLELPEASRQKIIGKIKEDIQTAITEAVSALKSAHPSASEALQASLEKIGIETIVQGEYRTPDDLRKEVLQVPEIISEYYPVFELYDDWRRDFENILKPLSESLTTIGNSTSLEEQKHHGRLEAIFKERSNKSVAAIESHLLQFFKSERAGATLVDFCVGPQFGMQSSYTPDVGLGATITVKDHRVGKKRTLELSDSTIYEDFLGTLASAQSYKIVPVLGSGPENDPTHRQELRMFASGLLRMCLPYKSMVSTFFEIEKAGELLEASNSDGDQVNQQKLALQAHRQQISMNRWNEWGSERQFYFLALLCKQFPATPTLDIKMPPEHIDALVKKVEQDCPTSAW